jgi:hypothetical protein
MSTKPGKNFLKENLNGLKTNKYGGIIWDIEGRGG